MSGEAKYSALQIAEWFLNYNVKIYQKIQNYMFSDLAMGNTG